MAESDAPALRARPPVRQQTAIAVLGALVVVTAAFRMRFWSAPLTADEGGYAYVARAWSRGAALYRDAWVDRPQGLLLLYRAVLGLGGHGLAIRLMATVWAGALVVVVGCLGRALTDDWRPGLWAAALFAVASAMPQLEGFAANGEVLAALPAALGVLLMVPTVRRFASGQSVMEAPPRRWHWRWIASGACCAAAVLIKQSGYDGAIGVTGVLGWAWTARWRPRREVAVVSAWWALGLIVPVGLAAAHGALIGWHDWWFAVAGYRLSVESVTTGPVHMRWILFRFSLHFAQYALRAVLPFALIGLMCGPQRTMWMIRFWAFGSLTAFALGGLFHPHYYLGLLPSLCVLAGLGVDRIDQSRRPVVQSLAVGAVTLGLLTMTASSMEILRLPSADARIAKAARDGRLRANHPLAVWLRKHSAPSDTIYAMYADAALYFEVDRKSPYPYLWQRGVEHIPGALQRLEALLDGPMRPRYVIPFGDPNNIKDGKIFVQILANRYRQVAIVAGVKVYERTT